MKRTLENNPFTLSFGRKPAEYISREAQAYLIRHDYPIYLLMTGLHRNLSRLQNDTAITFLLRTPRIDLEPLSILSIQDSYENVLGIDRELAGRLAATTRGCPFAYQVLGYLFWNSDGSLDTILPRFDTFVMRMLHESELR